ncbi:protein-disulfide reductase DsbD [Zestomonas carbonaria]|uniref:Thiol:disulfide interchange protein DsbD n=1 Tax=Zestomonas carbonaria TaxID=2762745 RepID=A0A7U7I8Z0_9GAMM|nr:protein-disulfide reductase DsbD [Pseudomonas carbonaria]CAD5107681.1 Thiol:disulfide interchange protein DsbD [Pseudomonas carbonaria]
MPLRRLLLPLLLLFLALPAAASLFDKRPNPELGAPLNNSADFLPVREAFRLSLVDSTPQSVKLRFVAADGYYLYRHRFQFRVEPADLAAGDAQLPPGEEKTDQYFGDVEVYYGVLDVELPLDNPYELPYSLHVTYQGCADKGLCYPPETERLDIGDVAGTPPAGETGWSWHALALFFLAGLGLTFTPCVLPMLPILSGVVLRGKIGGLRGLSLSLAYVLPMAACFAALGALMGVFGAELNLQARLQSPWVLVPFAAFFVLFALAMFGLYELRLPRLISEPLDRLAGKAEGGSLWGAALLGVLSSLLVSPCVSAPLAGALLYISASGDALGGGLKLFALGLGMGAPLVLFATGGGALLPKSGTWLVTVRNTFGVLLLAVSVWLLERVLPGPVALALWALLAAGAGWFLARRGRLRLGLGRHLSLLGGVLLIGYALVASVGVARGGSDPLRPWAGALAMGEWQTLADPAALDRALESAKGAGEPVLLDWYADWCISCKVIEREVFGAASVRERLGDYRLLRFDITASTPEQRTLLDRYKLFGPPAILFFAADGKERADLRVVGEVTLKEFAERLDKADRR